eukprot:TRINITY_DN4913_c0_g1_i2.p1 TRINITY_DN4913_c0_g1~~TRINITY_DN4913_c0_g1_i2.p1  ORF type:complete len:197 (+),score=43.98 TRINITY_DN4913_c0_g1_i2:81-671(+)
MAAEGQSTGGGGINVALESFNRALERRPIPMNMMISGLVNVLSELLSHFLTVGTRQRPRAVNIGRQFVLGSCVIAPLATTWFSRLGAFFAEWNQASVTTVLCKTACEQAFFAPFINTCFMLAQGLLEGRRVGDIVADIRKNFVDVQKATLCVWVPANLCSYKYVPIKFQVIFSNMVAVAWMLYLIRKTKKAEQKKA